MFYQPGVRHVWLDQPTADEIERVEQLFPEAIVLPVEGNHVFIDGRKIPANEIWDYLDRRD